MGEVVMYSEGERIFLRTPFGKHKINMDRVAKYLGRRRNKLNYISNDVERAIRVLYMNKKEREYLRIHMEQQRILENLKRANRLHPSDPD